MAYVYLTVRFTNQAGI